MPIVQEAGWAPGPVRTGAENLAHTEIRFPDSPARSQSLYRLSYPAHESTEYSCIIRANVCHALSTRLLQYIHNPVHGTTDYNFRLLQTRSFLYCKSNVCLNLLNDCCDVTKTPANLMKFCCPQNKLKMF